MQPTIQISLKELTPYAAVVLILMFVVYLVTKDTPPGHTRPRHTGFIRTVAFCLLVCAAVVLAAALFQEFGHRPPAAVEAKPSTTVVVSENPVSAPAPAQPEGKVAAPSERTRSVRYTGRVLDASGQPVPHALIGISGIPKTEKRADARGNFLLQFQTELALTESVLLVVQAGERQAHYYQLALDADNLLLNLP